MIETNSQQDVAQFELNNSIDPKQIFTTPIDTLDDYEGAANDILLVRLIKAETDIEDAKTDLERTTILREWVYANTNYAVQTFQTFNVEEDWYELVHPSRGKVSVGAHVGAHLRKEVGDMCGHLAWMLQRVYTLWGYESGRGGWTVPDIFSHTYTIVRIRSDGEWVWQLQDPTYDFALTNQGKPIDIYDVLLMLQAGHADRLSVDTGSTYESRQVLVHAGEIDNVKKSPDFYVSQTPEATLGEKLIFSTGEKWPDVGKTKTGLRISDYMSETFGLPKDPLYALLLVKNMPTIELWEKADAIKQSMLDETYQLPTD